MRKDASADKGHVGLHHRLLQQLGQSICSGEYAPGAILKIEDIEAKFDVSRTVVRECVRVLEAMGLLESRRRVGMLIQPASNWNLYDPQVIRWRLASPDRDKQFRSLTELRNAIEPEAARLAALRIQPRVTGELMGLAGKLWAAGESGESELFLALDIQFHELVLQSSGNEMFARLGGLVSEVLTGRTEQGLMPISPHHDALQLHIDVASAIQRGAPEAARDAMAGIVRRTMDELGGLFNDPQNAIEV